MQNKIYSTLAWLYNQVKNVVGNKNSLLEAIDDKVTNIPEVIDARDGKESLSSRLNIMTDHSLINEERIVLITDIVNGYNEHFEEIKNEIIDIKNTTPTVDIGDGNKLLVKIEKRPEHKEHIFQLLPNHRYDIPYSQEHSIYHVFLENKVVNNVADFDVNSATEFDEGKMNYTSNKLEAIELEDRFIPLWNGIAIGAEEDNVFYVENFCTVRAYTSGIYAGVSSHAIVAFKDNIYWAVRSNRAEIIIDFDVPIYINAFSDEAEANGLLVKRQLFVKTSKNGSYVLIGTKESQKVEMNVLRSCYSIKLIYSINSSSTNRFAVKNIRFSSKQYANDSGLIVMHNDSYDMNIISDDLSVTAKSSNQQDYKYLLMPSQEIGTGISYNPEKISIAASCFVSHNGNHVISDKLQNMHTEFSDINWSYNERYDSSQHDIADIPGTYNTHSYSHMVSSSLEGFKINDDIVQVLIDNVPIKLLPSDANKKLTININGKRVDYYFKYIKGTKTVKFKAESLDEITLKIISNIPRNLTHNRDSNSVKDFCKSSITSRCSNEYLHNTSFKVYDSHINYNCYTYTYTWSYKEKWVYDNCTGYWRWHWHKYWDWYHTGTSNSRSENYISARIAVFDTVDYKGTSINSLSSNIWFSDSYTVTSTSPVAYIGQDFKVANAIMQDGMFEIKTFSQKDVESTYTTCYYKGEKQRVIKVVADAIYNNSNDIRVALSNNNKVYYNYNSVAFRWEPTDIGMSIDMLDTIPKEALQKLFNTNEMHVKVLMNERSAIFKSISFEFDRDAFTEVSINQIHERGMTAEALSKMPGNMINDFINDFAKLPIVCSIKNKAWHQKFDFEGYGLINVSDVYWTKNTTQVQEKLTEKFLFLTNNTNTTLTVKVEQKVILDEYVSLDSDSANQKIEQISSDIIRIDSEHDNISNEIDIIKQAVTLSNNFSDWLDFDDVVPEVGPEFPDLLLPRVIEKKLPILSPQAVAEITDIPSVRHLQLWENGKRPVVSVIDNPTTLRNIEDFIYNDGRFTENGFEISRQYDTDNAYALDITTGTSSYVDRFYNANVNVTSKFADGTSANPLSESYGLARLINTDSYHSGSNYYYYWSNRRSCYWNLPGDSKRWVDIDISFKNSPIYIYRLYMDQGRYVKYSSTHYTTGEFQQFSTTSNTDLVAQSNHSCKIFYHNGDGDWKLLSTYAPGRVYANIQKECVAIRIRLEKDYATNRGAGPVSLKYFNIEYCPVRYVHDTVAKIEQRVPLSLKDIKEITSVYCDGTGYGGDDDIRYFIKSGNYYYKYTSTTATTPSSYSNPSYSYGMSESFINALTATQLNYFIKNSKDNLSLVAYLKSSDGHKTPIVHRFKISYVNEYNESITVALPTEYVASFDSENKKVIIKNISDSTKAYTAVIS